jgi:hypothetical protein
MEDELKTIEESIKAAEQRATEKAKFDQIRQEQIKKSVEEEKRLQERLKEISRLYISATKKLEADKAAEEAKAASTGTVFGTHEQTSDAETRAKEAEERRKAIEEYNHSNKEIRTRREHGQDDSDILRKRGETERTLRDTGGIPVTMGKVADEAEQLNRNVSRLLEQLQGVNAQIQTLS